MYEPSLNAGGLAAGLAIGVCGYAVLVLGRYSMNRRPEDKILPISPYALSMLVADYWPPKSWIMNAFAHIKPFLREGSTVVPAIWPLSGKRYYLVADAAAAKKVFNDRHGFIKDVEVYKIISFFGDNIVGTEGDEWARHRAISRKSFSERNNSLVWTETVSTLNDWFRVWDEAIERSADGTITIDVTTELRDMSLFIIASAGFGLHFSRDSMGVRTAGFKMPFVQSLFVAVETMIVKVLAPRWMYVLPIKKLQDSNIAYTELKQYIVAMISEARQGMKPGQVAHVDSEPADLFRRLIAANEEEQNEKARLADDELISNIFAFFLAGHETSAHTLTFALALLALHPEEQEKVYLEAKQQWPSMLDEAVSIPHSVIDLISTRSQWINSAQADYSGLVSICRSFWGT
ncbi:cytochrome P450 [Auriculariales sp. MPI-PUGE-AT-0066]|nr:cytochrome P450 [Auriculariales sp. MPI-PUGE-AT-0066]